MFRSRDVDPQETREWLEALDGVLRHDGHDRAEFLISELLDRASRPRLPGLPHRLNSSTPKFRPQPTDLQRPGFKI